MSTIRLLLLALVTLLLAPALADAAEQHGSYEENPRWGYKVRPPRDWIRRAVPLDEPWIADKFIPNHTMRARGPTGNFVQVKPDLWIIAFPHARQARRGIEEEKVDEHTTLIRYRNPYKDYKDFVKRETWASTGGGGWFFSREEDVENAGYQVTIYEVKVEKLVEAPLRLVTWVYHCADVDFAVQLRILEEQYDATKNVIDGVMKSFREIERTEPFPEVEEPDVRIPGESADDTRTLAEINAERLRAVTLRINREVKNLPKDWDVMQSKHFVCLTQIDKQHTRYVLNFAEEIRDYLDDNFEVLGEAEVPPGLIRVFKTAEDESAYRQGTRSWWSEEVGEISMTYGLGSSILWEFSWLAERLTDQYFHIKNANIKNGMPSWIRQGIWGHIRWGRPSKRKKLILAPTGENVRALVPLIKQGNALPLKQLMTMDTSDLGEYGHLAQAENVTFWLLGRGNKGKVKGALTLYLKSLETIIREEDEKFEKEQEKRWREQGEAAVVRPGSGEVRRGARARGGGALPQPRPAAQRVLRDAEEQVRSHPRARARGRLRPPHRQGLGIPRQEVAEVRAAVAGRTRTAVTPRPDAPWDALVRARPPGRGDRGRPRARRPRTIRSTACSGRPARGPRSRSPCRFPSPSTGGAPTPGTASTSDPTRRGWSTRTSRSRRSTP